MIKESREKSRLLIADDSKMNREIKEGRRFIFSTSIGFKYA